MSLDPITGIPAGATDRFYDGGDLATSPIPDGVDGDCSCGNPGAWSESFGAFLCGDCYYEACEADDADRAYDHSVEDRYA